MMHKIAPMRDAAASLASVVAEWASIGSIPEIEWAKMRSIEFQELHQSRDTMAQRLSGRTCTLCADFEDHVSLVRI
jgi:antiviral helicase SKI2